MSVSRRTVGGLCGLGLVLVLGAATLALTGRVPLGGQSAKADEPKEAMKLDADKIGKAAGTTATTMPDGVVRIGWPRTDVKVAVDGMSLKPFAGLGSWAAFKATKHGAMAMGDTVVFQDEVTPAMDAAFENGLEVTALHNHFFFDEPKVYFMHIGGDGDPEKLARGVKAVWDAIKAVRKDKETPATRFAGEVPKEGKLDQAAIGTGAARRPARDLPGVGAGSGDRGDARRPGIHPAVLPDGARIPRHPGGRRRGLRRPQPDAVGSGPVILTAQGPAVTGPVRREP